MAVSAMRPWQERQVNFAPESIALAMLLINKAVKKNNYFICTDHLFVFIYFLIISNFGARGGI